MGKLFYFPLPHPVNLFYITVKNLYTFTLLQNHKALHISALTTLARVMHYLWQKQI